jgi:DNA (cytosine-5)-methyltransferase 1
MDFVERSKHESANESNELTIHKTDVAKPKYRFADCFAGLGGFHTALSRLGHECVFACELDEELRGIYEQNYGIKPFGDIRKVKAEDVPAHDILCAGFPCQPFSLAGKKKGAACPKSGKLIEDVFRIVKKHKPRYVFLENVPNVLTIADGAFWEEIQGSLSEMGYRVSHRIYSPLQFGMPQQRYRLFIVATLEGCPEFDWPERDISYVRPLSEYITSTERTSRRIEPRKMRALEKWNEVIAQLKSLTSHTIIASEFGATYPLDGLPERRPWRHFKGAFGVDLEGKNREQAAALLPHYLANSGSVPLWMRKNVEQSRAIYAQAPEFFDRWKQEMMSMPNTWQKLEWRGDRSKPDLWKQTIQFRASGIRVMRPDMAPSLVAMTTTQTPIIGPKKRYISIREAAALQALDGLKIFPESNQRAFKALGNAVNAHIVHELAKVILV